MTFKSFFMFSYNNSLSYQENTFICIIGTWENGILIWYKSQFRVNYNHSIEQKYHRKYACQMIFTQTKKSLFNLQHFFFSYLFNQHIYKKKKTCYICIMLVLFFTYNKFTDQLTRTIKKTKKKCKNQIRDCEQKNKFKFVWRTIVFQRYIQNTCSSSCIT